MASTNNQSSKGPGRAYRKGISLIELAQMFPNDAAAEKWFQDGRWPGGLVRCPRCGRYEAVSPSTHPRMPFRCAKCRYFFSVKTGTVMEGSNIGCQKWAFAIYLMATNLKGTSSMHLHRDLGITQKSAWFMAHRIRKAWELGRSIYEGPVEVDEAFFGGKEKNKHASKKLHAGRGSVGKSVVVGVRDQTSGEITAKVVPNTSKAQLQGFVRDRVYDTTEIYTDESSAYTGLPNHQMVRHSIGEYVNNQAHVNGMESFWATLKRGYYGTYHRMSPAHLQRYVDEFAARHNQRGADTEVQMRSMAQLMVGRRLRYRELTVGVHAGPVREAQ